VGTDTAHSPAWAGCTRTTSPLRRKALSCIAMVRKLTPIPKIQVRGRKFRPRRTSAPCRAQSLPRHIRIFTPGNRIVTFADFEVPASPARQGTGAPRIERGLVEPARDCDPASRVAGRINCARKRTDPRATGCHCDAARLSRGDRGVRRGAGGRVD
jgi:hypothetical protein